MPTNPLKIDLTASGNVGFVDEAVFIAGVDTLSGTGLFNTFLQIQNNGFEQGYNTDATNKQFDEKSSDPHNHSLLLANIPVIIGDGSNGTVEGVAYRQFLLNINEPGNANKTFLSLDKLQIWQEESRSLTSFTSGAGFAGTHTNFMAFNLDAGIDRWIALKDLSSGNNRTDMQVLIPDSFFINDAAHRYVYLYSAFGTQNGFVAEGGSEDWGVAKASGGFGTTAALAVHKTATVPGGTADHAGEVITYSITVDNVGDKALTGITVSDPSVSDLAGVDANHDGFNDGDINHDGKLSVGETWSYVAHHTVTQAELDSNGDGLGAIFNTVTADSAETAAVTASASVQIERNFHATLVKSASVPGGTADAAGEVITYRMDLTNDGATTLTSPVVDDPMAAIFTPVLDVLNPALDPNVQIFIPINDGDFNLGDTNQNNVWDAGETFQFAYRGDIDLNGVHDPGETWNAINLGDANNDGIHQVGEIWVGDTNQNGIEDSGERWQFKNLGDTNNNHLQDPGETWQYLNAGDDNQNGVQDPGETWGFRPLGDTNQNGSQNAGETFTFFNTGDTNRNGIEDPGETFQFVVTSGVVAVDADHDGFNDGDANQDGQLNVGETWHYTFAHTVTQDEIDNGGVVDPGLTIDNTATASTDQADPTATGSASVAVEQRPDLAITKTADVASVDAEGDLINYAIDVENTGNMSLTNLVVSDPFVSNLAAVDADHDGFNDGDANRDGKLSVGETWHYTANHTVSQAEIDNGGIVNPALALTNTATADTDQTAPETASASVAVLQNPDLTITKTADVASVDAEGDVINYTIDVANAGNMSLTNLVVTDPFVSNLAAVDADHDSFNDGDANHDGKLSVGETWHYTASHTMTQAEIDNGGVVDPDLALTNTATADTDQTAPESASASVAVDQNPALDIEKTADVTSVDAAGDVINYTITVENTGNMSLTGLVVSDPFVSNLAAVDADSDTFNDGDVNHDGKLSIDETWQYTASHTVTQAEIDAGGTLNNTASASTAQGASDSDSASVTVLQPPHAAMTLDKSDNVGTHFVDSNENGIADTTGSGDLIQYIVILTNTGNLSINNVVVDDSLLTLGAPSGDVGNDGNLGVGETWVWDMNYFITDADAAVLNGGGAIHNEVTADGFDPSNNPVHAFAEYDQFFPVH